MSELVLHPDDRLEEHLSRAGYVFVAAEAMHQALLTAGSLNEWGDFVSSWDALDLDTYMADGGRYRRRRHAVFAAADGAITRQPHQAHYQTLNYNQLNGGIARWFSPISPEIGDGASLRTILGFCHGLFGGLAPAVRTWHVEVHQFRIEARPGEAGQPTPEGLHRDGVDYVLVLLVGRHNIASGTTTIHDLEKRELGSFTLTRSFDAALVDDARVYHGVTPVVPLDPQRPAHRDVLVVTFRNATKGG
ncbi:MAG TPA: 2OG-Fe dioxygenase family protein [Acetobacteraceae bacterium]|jgi:hypothetical protein|nr:2OG-Fe dioxygenase family protein [Acetobacteraceae bacterium]